LFAPRFGLFTIDYMKGTDKLAEDHLGDIPSQTYAQLIADSHKELKVTEVAEATEGKIASHKCHKDFWDDH